MEVPRQGLIHQSPIGPSPERKRKMPQEMLSTDEIVRRGDAVYEREIRPAVETAHFGEFLVLDVESGDYEIDSDKLAALDRARVRHPDSPTYILRIGFPAAVKLGGGRRMRRE